MALFNVVRGKTVAATLQGDVPHVGNRLVFMKNVYIVYQVDRLYETDYKQDPLGPLVEETILVHVNHERVME